MAYTDIDKPTDYFRVKTYSGNSSTQSITWDESDNMKPDWLWLKGRGYADGHALVDVIRGSTKNLSSDSTTAEFTQTNGVTSFDTNGWSMGNWSAINRSTSGTAVGWGWLAGGTASSNTDGSITSSVSANTTAGFSIVSYTGTGSSATVGHGLGVAPNVIITKKRNGTVQWNFQNSMRGYNEYMALNTTEASQSTGGAIINSVSSTTYSCDGNDVVNASSGTYVSYCFAEKKGFSKFGSYTGNGNADGTFVYTGFKPAFVLIKKSSSTSNWTMFDNKRDVDNVCHHTVYANLINAETTSDNKDIDMLSNGFKLRTSESEVNGSGNTFIYMAFAESPFVTSTGIPTTAR